MFCPSSHSIFLRSNGTLVCWDDYGSLREIQEFDPSIDYAKDVYLGLVYRNIRRNLRDGVMPFPDHCAKCHCLEAGFNVDTEHYTRAKAIETFQIEPSMGCQLECPGCIPRSERRGRMRKTSVGQMTLEPEVLYKIARDFHAAGITVKKFDMQGHGEPILHKKLWDMTAFIAQLYPHAINSICTHANGRFDRRMVHSGVNEVLFAIDGVDQASYAPYRVFGNFDKAFGFMSDFSRAAATEAPHIDRVWKYVVFSHNDTDEQLLRAQELALEAKITTLRFVLTQLGPVSARIEDGSEIPILDPALKVTIDRYRVNYEQLEAALASIADGLRRGNVVVAARWADFFSNSIFRLFRTTTKIPNKYRILIEEYDDLIADQPAASFGQYGVVRSKVAIRHKSRLQWETDENLKIFRPNSNQALLPPPAHQINVGAFRDVIARTEVDEAWYLRTYPEMANHISNGRIVSATQHYQDFGFLEHRLPYQPIMDEDWYLATYPDVRAAVDIGMNVDAVDHFVHHGYREGRRANPYPLALPRPIQAQAKTENASNSNAASGEVPASSGESDDAPASRPTAEYRQTAA
jgi:hypothetical protein